MLIQCDCCKRRAQRHLRVAYIDAHGAESGSVRVCSLICLVRWAQEAAVSKGIRGVRAIKEALEGLTGLIRGG